MLLINTKRLLAALFFTFQVFFSCDGALTTRELFAAAKSGDIALMDQCLETMDVNTQSAKGKNTPLQIAVIFGQFKMVKHLVDTHNADVNLTSKVGDTPLFKACRLLKAKPCMYEIIQFLLEVPSLTLADSADAGPTPLGYLVEDRDLIQKDLFNALLLTILKRGDLVCDEIIFFHQFQDCITVFDALFELLNSDEYKAPKFVELRKAFFLAVFRNCNDKEILKQMKKMSEEFDGDTLRTALNSFMALNKNNLDLIR